MKKYLFIFLLGMAAVITSCSKEEEPEEETNEPMENTCETTNVTFSGFVKSKINGSCASAGCHGAAKAAGFDLSGYEDIKKAADSGRLFGAISHASGFSPMPKGGSKMDDCSLDKIKSWIDDGALDN